MGVREGGGGILPYVRFARTVLFTYVFLLDKFKIFDFKKANDTLS